MKKLLVVFVFYFTIENAQAQLFTYGPKVGLNFSFYSPRELDFNGTYTIGDGGNTAFQVGFFFIRDFPGFFLQVEPTYFMCKTKLEDPQNDVSDYKAKGVNFAILAGKKINQFRIFAGMTPYVGLNSDVGSPRILSDEGVVDYTLGLGFDISKIIVNLRYSGPLLGGTTVNVSQLTFSAGLKLNKN